MTYWARESIVGKVLALQAAGPEFKPQSPFRKDGCSGMCLQSQHWGRGSGDRQIPGLLAIAYTVCSRPERVSHK